jgi:hypothetical protein
MPITIHSDVDKAVSYLSPIDVLSENPSPEAIKEAITYISKKYLLDESQLLQVIKCESSFNHNQYGDSGKAFGLAQFHKPTFNQYCKGNYYSAKDQLICLAEMWQNGKQKHWSCWKKYFTS